MMIVVIMLVMLDVITVMSCVCGCCSCTSCTSSTWGCSWCIHRSRCLQPDHVDQCSENAVTDKQVMHIGMEDIILK